MAQCKISLKDCLSNPNVEIKQALMDASNKKLDNSFLFLNLAYSGAKKKSGGGGGGGASAGGAAGADGGEGQADGMFCNIQFPILIWKKKDFEK